MKKKHKINMYFLFWIFLFAILAMIVPETILTKSALVSTFTEIMMDIVPSIQHFTDVSSFPQITSFLSSLMWFLLPFQTVVFLKLYKLTPDEIDIFVKYAKSIKWTYAFFAILLPAVFVLIPFYFPEIKPEDLEGRRHHVILRMVSTDRLWFGIIGETLFMGMILIIFIFVSWLKSIPKIYFK